MKECFENRHNEQRLFSDPDVLERSSREGDFSFTLVGYALAGDDSAAFHRSRTLSRLAGRIADFNARHKSVIDFPVERRVDASPGNRAMFQPLLSCSSIPDQSCFFA